MPIHTYLFLVLLNKDKINDHRYYCTCSDSVFSILSHLTVADPVFVFFLACPNLIKYVLVSIYTRGPLPHWVAYVIPSFATDRSMFLMWVCEFFLSWRSWLALRNLSLVYLLSSNLFCPSSIALHLLLTDFLLSYLNVSSSGKSCVMVSYLSGLVYLTPKMMAPLGIAQKAPRTPANTVLVCIVSKQPSTSTGGRELTTCHHLWTTQLKTNMTMENQPFDVSPI